MSVPDYVHARLEIPVRRTDGNHAGSTRGGMIDRYLAAREKAVAIPDGRLVAEIDFHLARLGYRPDDAAAAQRAEASAEAEAQPARTRGKTRRAARRTTPDGDAQ